MEVFALQVQVFVDDMNKTPDKEIAPLCGCRSGCGRRRGGRFAGSKGAARVGAAVFPGLWAFDGPHRRPVDTVALTIDDAPGHEPLLEEVLAALAAHGATATFFVMAGSVEACAERWSAYSEPATSSGTT